MDFWLSPVSMELPVDIRVPSSSLSSVSEILSANNIAYSVLINDLQERLDEEKFEMMENHIKERSGRSFNFGAYHRLETIYSWMDTLVSEYSTLVTKLEIGRSYENRPMYVLKFSKGGNKPAIWIDTGIHSREWVSQATGVWTANKIATDYGTDASLLDNMDIYMLILANPDGYDYTHNNDRMWRKTRSENPGSMCRGVDPNRNWDAGFGGPGASRNPCSDSYHGPSAHSEIEVKNVVNFIKNHGNFKSFISVHAYSQLLMYPYGYSCKNAAHQAELVRKEKKAKSIKYSFAFELRDTGNSGFLLPPTQIIPTASETWLALKHIMEYLAMKQILGKSNVMDAISFAMGERAACLRVKHLRDLVHGAHIGRPVPGTARVSLQYCDQEDQETVFCRSIFGDSSEYRINGVHVSLAKYLEELQKIGIVTKARNCLVFQGAVESIALKDPKERTKMFEVISQSKEYAAEYDQKKEALIKAKEDTQFHFNKKKSAIVERKQVSQEKVELSLAELFHNKKGVRAFSDTLTEKQQVAAAQSNKLMNAEQKFKSLKKEHGRLSREQQQVDKEICAQARPVPVSIPVIKAKVNTSHHMKKAEELRAALRKIQKWMAFKEQELAEGRERSVERYKELKELARKQGAVFTQQAEKLHWEVRADREKMAFDQRRKKEVEAAIRSNQTHLQDLTRRAEKLEEYTKSCKYVKCTHFTTCSPSFSK
ncbi:hypothetical protein F7725_023279 [Dissostichus mawsoni]|uniref:Peptidase M14 domain-containing protein n=1 Tax=Dissostichus mawsoni TaxID=36200 RepID=A0A7J5Z092_DISMA|nr:hypothetical protein F7725_023279 [Dissostichus mawsoni]